MTTLAEQRTAIRHLLNELSPADAFTAYYALYHDPRRTTLFLHNDPGGWVDGFIARAQTGLDLFRPVAVLRAAAVHTAIDLLRTGLAPNRPYYMVAPLPLSHVINRTLTVSDAEVLCVYRLDPAGFDPEINVLVVSNPAPDGTPRFQINANDTPQAVAGVNWQSPGFAEVYVFTESAARGRGWGNSVVSALVSELLKSGRMPLYVVNEQNTASINLATSIGFVDTGAREYAGQVVLSQ
ncbi:MAG TPA: GNAT family N-acetyltransferase [Anaerolineales bacterium]|nr:GNAT family N-acetyltransferase [Anaerolineales bacterium]HLB50203.1 GNAT family N-acetyltransferase [Anaerolineales bacterium]